jgi:hypothetical protein
MFQEEIKEELAEENREREEASQMAAGSRTVGLRTADEGLRVVYKFDTALRKYSLNEAPL